MTPTTLAQKQLKILCKSNKFINLLIRLWNNIAGPKKQKKYGTKWQNTTNIETRQDHIFMEKERGQE